MATPNPNIIYRSGSVGPLTFDQLDGNFAYLSQSIANIVTPVSTSYASTASYVEVAQTASYFDGTVENASTASYVEGINVDGQVTSAASADNASTASYVDAANVNGTVTSASYALSSSYAPSSNPFPFIGDAEFSGSILVSGSIIPNTDGVSSTSSFSLGSPTAAWKDIYVSNGTINFLDGAGNVQSTIGTGNNQLTGDTFINGKLTQGENVTASGAYSHAEGTGSKALGIAAHAEGRDTIAGGYLSGISAAHAEGRQTTASGRYSHTEGQQTYALGEASHAEGFGTFTNGTAPGSHAEGYYARTDGGHSHAEGSGSTAWSDFSHAEGIKTYTYDPMAPTNTSGQPALGSHAEGEETITVGRASHAEGYQTYASGSWSHAEGYGTYAAGDYSHAEGLGTVTAAPYQHASGKFNLLSFDENDLFAVGNGTSYGSRSNALTVKMSGSIALPTTQSAAPSWTGVDGEIVPATVGGQYFLYMWMGGAWRSGSFV
jgi:hypothetical protein